MLKFDFVNETKTKISKALFQKVLKKGEVVLEKKIKKLLKKRTGHIDLVLTNDRKIAALNKEYRGKSGPTDVIAFAYLEVTKFEKEQKDVIVGDIFISLDTAKRQAKAHKHTLNDELKTLFVHGFLHLFGFDHKTKKQEKEMETWAREVVGGR